MFTIAEAAFTDPAMFQGDVLEDGPEWAPVGTIGHPPTFRTGEGLGAE